jgi:hypothetical protein
MSVTFLPYEGDCPSVQNGLFDKIEMDPEDR